MVKAIWQGIIFTEVKTQSAIGEMDQVDTSLLTKTTYQDEQVESGHRYYYRITPSTPAAT